MTAAKPRRPWQAFRSPNMQKKILRLAPSVSVLAIFLGQLGGCGDAQPPCATNADCAPGQSCSVGTCIASQTPTAGAAGSPSSFAGSTTGGSASVAGSGGIVSGGGNVAVAGSNGVSGSGGHAGTQASAGSSSQGGNGTSGSGSGGMSGSGTGGAPVNPITVGQCKDDFWPAANNGSVTRYDFKQGTSLPACAYAITHTGNGSEGDWDTVEGISTGNGGYFGAMNTADFAQGAACGACVEASYNGKKVVLTIVDECPLTGPVPNPLCVKGHIDLSRKAIRQLEPNTNLENLKGVSWKYVKCPAIGNVQARLHPNQNANWQPVVIENGLYPLKSVTLNGVNATRAGNASGGNAWLATGLGQKAPYTVHATDVNNNAITFSYSGGSGLKDVGLQFMCQ
jgi:expansin (peptidoglycan-binding protein)